MDAVGAKGLRSYRLGASNFGTEVVDGGALFNLSERTLRSGRATSTRSLAEIFLKEGVPLDARRTEHEIGNVMVEVSDGVAVVVGPKSTITR